MTRLDFRAAGARAGLTLQTLPRSDVAGEGDRTVGSDLDSAMEVAGCRTGCDNASVTWAVTLSVPAVRVAIRHCHATSGCDNQ